MEELNWEEMARKVLFHYYIDSTPQAVEIVASDLKSWLDVYFNGKFNQVIRKINPNRGNNF